MSTNLVKKTKVIQTRLDADLINEATSILDNIGITTTDLVRIVLKKLVNTGKVPVSLQYEEPQFSSEKIKDFENLLDNYYSGTTKTIKVSNPKELDNLLTKMAD